MPKLNELTNEDVGAIIESMELFRLISEEMQDPELDRALMYIAKIIEKPDMPTSAAAFAIVQLSGIAAKFGMAQSWYKTYGKAGTSERYKKDIYYTARDAINNLVDSLKYIIRAQESR